MCTFSPFPLLTLITPLPSVSIVPSLCACLLVPLSYFSLCVIPSLEMYPYVPIHHNQTSLFIHVAPGYHSISPLLFSWRSRLSMTCPRQRSTVPPSLYFHTPLPYDTMIRTHTHFSHKTTNVCSS